MCLLSALPSIGLLSQHSTVCAVPSNREQFPVCSLHSDTCESVCFNVMPGCLGDVCRFSHP